MYKLVLLPVLLFSIASCTKQKPPVVPEPTMKYIDLHDSTVKFQKLHVVDLDGNGSFDLYFSTMLIGDPILKQDRLAFIVTSTPNNFLMGIDNTDVGKRMNKGETIAINPPLPYDWFEVVSLVLAEKVVPETGAPFWRGDWKDATHHYLPVQVKSNGIRYLGWVEISMDIFGEKLILHKAAISTLADKEAKAGY